RTGTALVRCHGLLRGSQKGRPPWRAAGRMELSAAPHRGRGARPPFLQVLFGGGWAVLAARATAHRGGLQDAAVSFRGNRDAAVWLRSRLEPRTARGLREQLVRHGALSAVAGHGSRASLARIALGRLACERGQRAAPDAHRTASRAPAVW